MTRAPRIWLEATVVFAVLALVHSWYAFHALSLFDVGVMLECAVRVQQGELFLRDFMAPYGPLRYWVLRALSRLFGAPLVTWCWTPPATRCARTTSWCP